MKPFHFQQFSVYQNEVAHAVGTDGVLLGAWAAIRNPHTILDIGTGTGVVALILAQRTAHITPLTIDAIELHDRSAAQATENMLHSPWAQKMKVFHQSIQDFAANTSHRYDLIVSNPPFFENSLVSPDETRRLGRSTDTLSFEDLLFCVSTLLSEEGIFCVILPYLEGKRLCELAVPLGLYWTKETAVIPKPGKGVERLLIQFERNPHHFTKNSLLCREADGTYSEEFKALTSGFYL